MKTLKCMFLLVSSLTLSAQTPQQLEWKFTSSLVKGREVVALPAGISGRLDKQADIRESIWHLHGNNGLVINKLKGSQLPKKNFSVSALLSLRRKQAYGGIIGCSQDNGSYERGWLLGYDNHGFYFLISNGGSLQKLSMKASAKTGEFYHVAATYDGKTAKLYVNGELTSEKIVAGGVVYDNNTPLIIAAYRDKDENFPMHGRLAQVNFQQQVLSAAQVKKIAKVALGLLPQQMAFSGVPLATYIDPSSCMLSFANYHKMPVRLKLTNSEGKHTYFDSPAGFVHRIKIKGLKSMRKYTY